MLSNLFLSLSAAATLGTHSVRCDSALGGGGGARKFFFSGFQTPALDGPVATVKIKARQGSSAANVYVKMSVLTVNITEEFQ